MRQKLVNEVCGYITAAAKSFTGTVIRSGKSYLAERKGRCLDCGQEIKLGDLICRAQHTNESPTFWAHVQCPSFTSDLTKSKLKVVWDEVTMSQKCNECSNPAKYRIVKQINPFLLAILCEGCASRDS